MQQSHNIFYVSFSLIEIVVYFYSQQMHSAVCVYVFLCLFLLINCQIIYLIPNTLCSSLLSTDMVNTKTTFWRKGLIYINFQLPVYQNGSWGWISRHETRKQVLEQRPRRNYVTILFSMAYSDCFLIYQEPFTWWQQCSGSCYIQHTKENAPWTHLQARIQIHLLDFLSSQIVLACDKL